MSDGLDTERLDRAALDELGWTNPPPVPARPGADLSWEVATADDVEFIVASDPGNPDAWVAAATLRDAPDG